MRLAMSMILGFLAYVGLIQVNELRQNTFTYAPPVTWNNYRPTGPAITECLPDGTIVMHLPVGYISHIAEAHKEGCEFGRPE